MLDAESQGAEQLRAIIGANRYVTYALYTSFSSTVEVMSSAVNHSA